MAASSEEVGESTAPGTVSSYVVNGVEQSPFSASQGDTANLPSMESMLEVATDLQSDHVEQKVSQISGRLELNHPAVESHAQMQNTGRLIPPSLDLKGLLPPNASCRLVWRRTVMGVKHGAKQRNSV